MLLDLQHQGIVAFLSKYKYLANTWNTGPIKQAYQKFYSHTLHSPIFKIHHTYTL